MRLLTFEDVTIQDRAINYKWELILAETSNFGDVTVIDENDSKINGRMVELADNAMRAHEECDEHIVPIRQAKFKYYDGRVNSTYYGRCVKCGESCENYNGQSFAGIVKNSVNAIYPDLEELDAMCLGNNFSLDDEEYEHRFNELAKITYEQFSCSQSTEKVLLT